MLNTIIDWCIAHSELFEKAFIAVVSWFLGGGFYKFKNERRAEKERKSATITMTVRKGRLVISNTGLHDARELTVETATDFFLMVERGFFPYPVLHPGESIGIPFTFAGNGTRRGVTAFWTDGNGDNEKTENISTE